MPNKRQLMHAVGFASASFVTGVCAPAILASHTSAREGKGVREKLEQIAAGSKEEVSPPEDLMREHGVLDRVLLCYEAALAKFSANEDFDPALVTQSAEIIRDFMTKLALAKPTACISWRLLGMIVSYRQAGAFFCS
jgi:hypothetical protein